MTGLRHRLRRLWVVRLSDGPGSPVGQAAPARVLTCQPAPAGNEPLRGRPWGAGGRGCAIPSPSPGRAVSRPGPGPRSPSSALRSPPRLCLLWAHPSAGPEGAGRQVREARRRGGAAGHHAHSRGGPASGPGHCACAQEAWGTSVSSCVFPDWRPCLWASRTRFLGQLCPGNARVPEMVLYLSTSLAGPFACLIRSP